MRSVYLSLLLIPVIFLSACGKTEIHDKKYFQTFTVGIGNVVVSDRILATVEGEETASLAFKASGRIAEILAKPGDVVKKWQILARLGNEEGGITTGGLSRVIGDLAGMNESIAKLYDGRIDNLANDEQKALIGIELAQKDLDLARETLQNSLSIFSGSILSASEKVAQADKNLAYSRNNLENSRKLLDVQDESLRKNALNSLSQAFIIARNARDFADETLGVTDANRYKNDAFESYLGAKDSKTKTRAESDFRSFDAEYQIMYAWYYSNIVNQDDISKETLNEALSKSLVIMEKLRNTLHSLSTVLEYSIAGSSFSDSALKDLKSKTSTLLSGLELAILDPNGNGVKWSIAAILAFDSSYALKIQQLQDAVELAEADLTLARAGKDTSSSDVRKNLDTLALSIKMKEDALRMAKLEVSAVEKNRKILRSERESKISELDSKISEVRMNRDLAGNSVESGIIRAPFDGVVLARNFDPGAVVNAGWSVFSISSTQAMLAKTYFDATDHPLSVGDIIRMRSGQTSFTGKIRLVNQNPDAIHNKAYLEVFINDFPGLIGDRVEVILDKKVENSGSGVVIPNTAIISKYSEPGVYVLDNGRAKFILIQVLRLDGKFSSVGWVVSGQKVITDGKENVLDGEILE